jgi:hypothetical protein
MMPRFYFHVREGAHLVRDEEGTELRSYGEARAQALQSARELWADAIKAGRDLGIDTFVIADDRGGYTMLVHVAEALPRRLRSGVHL